MSTALPYLQKLRKPQLTEWAEFTDLNEYEDFTKPELAAALDSHLQKNRSIFHSDTRLSDYYRRLAQSPRTAARVASPAKRGLKVEETPSADEAPKSVRRRPAAAAAATPTPKPTPKPKLERTPSPDSDVPETPAQPLLSVQPPAVPSLSAALPPSPAVVTDAIDRQTAVWGKAISDTWSGSGVQERADSLRSNLSSVKAVSVLLFSLEALSLSRILFPLRFVTTASLHSIGVPFALSLKVPDVFVLVESSFWAPFSLWLLTNLLLPLTVAYFFNLSLQSTRPSSPTRRSRPTHASFDPLSFHIAKALLTYLVFGSGFTFWDVYAPYTVEMVDKAILGHWTGTLTGSTIGVIATLYEAILQK
ncbi:hypothetical protein BO70DRAFT_328665 [Aspergillus heteromorphus CBS 117.55]|uniref:Uncharacterized protein n=1 Tax=Aspergillus heteromorphus CBS 117.55 TaxID=1448321 RepID=A0A317WXK1_9EURO|nr:uncharacterized protein BO70DRAFT_328665 [Aspergillus heteromorphus CBS 117.55]PWY90745.1 hypothetical protein BO70DRAFT_328665 [Aspergillus heteromorphus CBS 117.55]